MHHLRRQGRMACPIANRLNGGKGESSHCTGTDQLDDTYSKMGKVTYTCIRMGVLDNSLGFKSDLHDCSGWLIGR